MSVTLKIELFTSRVTLDRFPNLLNAVFFISKKGRDSKACYVRFLYGHRNSDKIQGVQTVGALILSALPSRD